MTPRDPQGTARILHLALRSDWEAARSSGRYTTSTLGRSLEEEGFIHASRDDQWQGVRDRYYADVAEPLVLLVIDTGRLTAPVVEEVPPGSDESFPHVYGPVNTDAVVQVVPLDEHGRASTETFSAIFLREMFRNLVVATLLLVIVVVGALVGESLDREWGPLSGTAAAFLVGVPAAVLLHRRLRR